MCGKSEKETELRGTKNRGMPNGLWCRVDFKIGSPGQAYLKWDHAMSIAEYNSADREWMKRGYLND